MNEKLKGTISMQDLMYKYESDSETLKTVRVMLVIDDVIYKDRLQIFKNILEFDARIEGWIMSWRGKLDRKTPFTNEEIGRASCRERREVRV